MKINKIIIFSLILIIGLTFISAISAQNVSDVNSTYEINDIYDNNILTIDENSEIISNDSSCCDGETQTATWYVEPNSTNPNQVQKPTVQPAIDNANDGDTIILNGTFVHCHFTINKNLTLIAAPETTVGVCPHHNHPTGSTNYGIFYINSEGSGSTLDGFGFTNGFFNMAYDEFNPFGVFVDGASNVNLKNLIFNWSDVKTSNYDPDDFKFNPIILKNAQNITIENVFFNNTNSLITNINSTNITFLNPTIIQTELSQVSVDKPNVVVDTNIDSSDLTIYVGDSSSFKISLQDNENNSIVNKSVLIVVDGKSKNITTDENGSANLDIKFTTAGIHYVTTLFAGDDEYKTAISFNKIVANKKSSSLTAAKATFKVKKAKKLSLTLKSNGKAIKNKKISVKVNGKTYSAKTNSKGIAKIKIKVAKKGTFKYIAKFAGDSIFKSVSKTAKFTVK